MKRLWAPWRIEYIALEKTDECIFCKKLLEKDGPKNLILYRGKHTFAMLNKFPYNSGHLMIAPFRHVRGLSELKKSEKIEMLETLSSAIKVLTEAMSPQGFNIGLNIGRVAGAGVPDHIHFHVVPRWEGDCNFMPLFADVKIINEHLTKTYKKLLPYWRSL
mgnify:CR=1 FL=1